MPRKLYRRRRRQVHKVPLRIGRAHLHVREAFLIIKKRYGSDHDFTQVRASYKMVAKSVGVSETTVLRVVKRFHANGD